MHLTAKVKIYPTEDQLKVLWELSDKCCSLYNLALAERKDAWKTENKNIKYIDQQNKLPEFKKNNPEYKAVYSKVLQGILKKLDANYKSFFALWKNGDTKARPPNFKSINFFKQFLTIKVDSIKQEIICVLHIKLMIPNLYLM
jgi:putative transposase